MAELKNWLIHRCGEMETVTTDRGRKALSLGLYNGCLCLFTEDGHSIKGIKELKIESEVNGLVMVTGTFLIDRNFYFNGGGNG